MEVIFVVQLVHRMPEPPLIGPAPSQQPMLVFTGVSIDVPATPTYVTYIWKELHTFVALPGMKSGSTVEGQRYVLMVTLSTAVRLLTFCQPEVPEYCHLAWRALCSMPGRMYTNQEEPQLLVPFPNGCVSSPPPGGIRLLTSWKACSARPICLRLFWHLARAAASRTFWTAGSSRPMRIAMIAITTSNSMSVKPLRLLRGGESDIGGLG
jgi:hypothetical protein